MAYEASVHNIIKGEKSSGRGDDEKLHRDEESRAIGVMFDDGAECKPGGISYGLWKLLELYLKNFEAFAHQLRLSADITPTNLSARRGGIAGQPISSRRRRLTKSQEGCSARNL